MRINGCKIKSISKYIEILNVLKYFATGIQHTSTVNTTLYSIEIKVNTHYTQMNKYNII